MKLYSTIREEAWISGRTLKLLGILLTLDVTVINAVTPYRASAPKYALAIWMVVLLTAAAFKIHKKT